MNLVGSIIDDHESVACTEWEYSNGYLAGTQALPAVGVQVTARIRIPMREWKEYHSKIDQWLLRSTRGRREQGRGCGTVLNHDGDASAVLTLDVLI